MATIQDPEDQLLSPQQLSRLLSLSEVTLFKYRQAGTGPLWFKLENGRVRYWRSDVEAWMEQEGRTVA